MQRLIADGYENCHGDGAHTLIVNNRGEIEFTSFGKVPTARIYDRLVVGYGDHSDHTDIESLMDDVKRTWTKEEFPE